MPRRIIDLTKRPVGMAASVTSVSPSNIVLLLCSSVQPNPHDVVDADRMLDWK